MTQQPSLEELVLAKLKSITDLLAFTINQLLEMPQFQENWPHIIRIKSECEQLISELEMGLE